MSTSLKHLAVAAAAAAALLSASASSAAAAEFHCSLEPCHAQFVGEGSSKEASQVFFVRGPGLGLGSACTGVSGEGTLATKTATELTVTNVKYTECATNGVPEPAVKMNGCHYVFTSAGQMSIKCPIGARIEWGVWGCLATIGPQSALTGVTFTNAGTKHTRLELKAGPVKGIALTMANRPGCFETALKATEGEINRSNDFLTVETEGGGMANIWWE